MTSFITGVFVFAEYASLELKQMLSSLSTYRTDIWLAKLGYEPVLYSSEYALKKQPHNFFIQLLDYNYLGLFFLIIFILNIQKSVNTITGPLVILFLFSSFSLNGGSSTIFIILLITLFNYEKNTSG